MTDTRERARARVREIDRNESALAIELFDGNRWFTISLPPNRRVAELQHELLTLSLAAFAESEADLARKQERLECAKVLCEDCRIGEYVEPAVFHDGKWRHKAKDGLGAGYFSCDAAAIHERNLAETGG